MKRTLTRILGSALLAAVSLTPLKAQTLFKDLVPEPDKGSEPGQFITVSGTMYFITRIGNGSYVHRLWKSDGTADGTVVVKDSIINTNILGVIELYDVNGTLFYVLAKNGSMSSASLFEIWKTDGTTTGTVMIDQLSPAGVTPRNFTVVGSKLFFSMGVAGTGNELWVCDGTPGSTAMVVDLNPGGVGGVDVDQPMVAYNGKVYFKGSVSNQFGGPKDVELYSSDGTAAGTTLVNDINAGMGDSNPFSFVVYDSRLFFCATDVNGGGLFKTDGTSAGTTLVAAVNFQPKTVFKDELYGTGGPVGIDLWKSDGTAAGTMLVMDSANVINGATSDYLFTQYMKFIGTAPYYEMLYKKTDGTTETVVSYDHGNSASRVVIDNKMYQRGTTYPTPGNNGLWVNDGTEAGTALLFNAAYMGDPYAYNGMIFFSNFVSGKGYELCYYTPEIVAGISENQFSAAELVVYPNPTSGIVHVDGLTEYDGALLITDFSGRVVLSEQWHSGTTSHTLDLSHLPDGLYIVSDNAGGMKKLVLRR